MAQPNVIFIISDQHRWDFMGYEGNGVTHTPNLDRMGHAGTIFLHVGFAGPHSPIEPHPAFMDLYRDVAESQPWGALTSPE